MQRVACVNIRPSIVIEVNMDNLTLTLKEVCQLLNISRPTLYKYLNNKTLCSFTIGTRRFVTPEALRKFIADREDAA